MIRKIGNSYSCLNCGEKYIQKYINQKNCMQQICNKERQRKIMKKYNMSRKDKKV